MALTALLKKAEHFDRVIQEKHNIEGLVLPTIAYPQGVYGLNYNGNYENCAIWTGLYIAAQSFLYAATGDPSAKEKAKQGVSALYKLQDLAGYGNEIIARGFKHIDDAHEDLFWKESLSLTRTKDEWHKDDGYMWLGKPSKSQIFGAIFGYFAYTQHCDPTAEEKLEIGSYVKRIVDRIIDKTTRSYLYSKYEPFLWSVGPQLMLGKLKLCASLTGDSSYEEEYRRLLDEEGYAKRLSQCRWKLRGYRNISSNDLTSEDNLAMLNYMMLLTLEDNWGIRDRCLRGVSKRWNVIDDPENALHNFAYHALTGTKTDQLEIAIEALERFPTLKEVPIVARKRVHSSKLACFTNLFDGSVTPMRKRSADEFMWRYNPRRKDGWVEGKPGCMQFTGVDFLIAFGLGRMHNFIE